MRYSPSSLVVAVWWCRGRWPGGMFWATQTHCSVSTKSQVLREYPPLERFQLTWRQSNRNKHCYHQVSSKQREDILATVLVQSYLKHRMSNISHLALIFLGTFSASGQGDKIWSDALWRRLGDLKKLVYKKFCSMILICLSSLHKPNRLISLEAIKWQPE